MLLRIAKAVVAVVDQEQKDEVVVVVVHVDSTLLAEEVEVVPSVDDAEAAEEVVHNNHIEQEVEHTSFRDNHI